MCDNCDTLYHKYKINAYKEQFYMPCKNNDRFLETIENYGDGKYTVMYNALSGYDNIMRVRASTWTDEYRKEHWREEWLPVMCIYNKRTEMPDFNASSHYWISELDRTHVRNLNKKIEQYVQDIIDHNNKLKGIPDAEYRKKQAYHYTKRWASNFCSVTMPERTWGTKQ